MNQIAKADEVLAHGRGLLDLLNCGALIVDRTGAIVHANARLCRLMQQTCSTLTGQFIWDLYPTDAHEYLRDKLVHHFDESGEGEFFLPTAGGERLPIIASGRPMPASTGLADYRIITFIDISAQKQAEQALKDQYDIIAKLSNTILEQALDLQKQARELEQRVRQRTGELHEANLDAIFMLAVASEAKDQDTGAHVRRIRHYTQLLARRIGYGEEAAETMGYSAILHDVGKIHVPDDILKKPGPLTPPEWSIMQSHTLQGERILSTKPFFEQARRIARSHHENWDGSGYPDGIKADQIPIDARLVRVADVYDALTSTRAYKSAWTPRDAADTIRSSSGVYFDPEVVKAFEDLHQSGEWRRTPAG